MVYCTKDDVKAYSKISYSDLGFASDAAFDTFLDGLIGLAQGIINSYCSVPSGFFDAGGISFTNQLYDYRHPWIDIWYFPVLSVSKVEYNDQGYGTTANWITVTEPDYIINKGTGQLMLVEDTPAIVDQSVRVSYTAGYSSVPDVIKQVAIQLSSNILHEILQRKLSPLVRADDLTIKVLIPETLSRSLQSMLTPYARRVVAVG